MCISAAVENHHETGVALIHADSPAGVPGRVVVFGNTVIAPLCVLAVEQRLKRASLEDMGFCWAAEKLLECRCQINALDQLIGRRLPRGIGFVAWVVDD